MIAAQRNLTIYRGLTFGVAFKATKAGVPVDLTGWQAFAHGQAVAPGHATLDLAPVVSDPTGGMILVNLSDAATLALTRGVYRWDMILQRPDGSRLGPFIAGEISVVEPVTQP